MANARKAQSSLDSFFKKTPAPAPAPLPSRLPSSKAGETTPYQSIYAATSFSRATDTSLTSGAVNGQDSRHLKRHAAPHDGPSSTPLSDAPGSSPPSSTKANEPALGPGTAPTRKVVKSSDDEDSDSDSSLIDIATLLQAHHPTLQSKASSMKAAPSTPKTTRFRSNHSLNSSPIVVPKYKFDLKSLANLAKADDAIEASSKRVKALLTPVNEMKDDFFSTDVDSQNPKPNHLDLLESVVADREGGEVQRVTRAIKRTEATLSDDRWYFFNAQVEPIEEKGKPFPKKFIPKSWTEELLDVKTRHQTFISGFAEDMVSYGKTLPDEIFLWMLGELCREPSEALRWSYSGILRESTEQVTRLVGPSPIESLFKGLGASPSGISVSEKIRPSSTAKNPYSTSKWDRLCSVIGFLGQVARYLEQTSRVYTISLLLRMSIDRVVFDNLDVFDQVQDTIGRICRHVPDNAWEAFVSCLFPCPIISNSE